MKKNFLYELYILKLLHNYVIVYGIKYFFPVLFTLS
jgi:hypothetical protein